MLSLPFILSIEADGFEANPKAFHVSDGVRSSEQSLLALHKLDISLNAEAIYFLFAERIFSVAAFTRFGDSENKR